MPTPAFLDLDGTLVRSNLMHIAMHHAARRATLSGRAANLLGLAAAAPALAALDKLSRSAFQDLFYRGFAGLSEDRLRYLGEHAAEHVLLANLRDESRDLLDRIRRAGLTPVLLTGNLAHVVEPFARHLGIELWFSNQLEVRDGFATGKLAPPLRSGANKAGVIRQVCADLGATADACYAYSDAIADLPMLAAVGHPCAVHPDLGLRSEARSHDWPILTLDHVTPPKLGARSVGALMERRIEDLLSRAVSP